jgi:hypothetical protein
VVCGEKLSRRAGAAGKLRQTIAFLNAPSIRGVLAPEKLVGWNRAPAAAELPYLPAVVRGLPVIGRLTGRGSTNLETIIGRSRILFSISVRFRIRTSRSRAGRKNKPAFPMY